MSEGVAWDIILAETTGNPAGGNGVAAARRPRPPGYAGQGNRSSERLKEKILEELKVGVIGAGYVALKANEAPLPS